MHKTPIPYLFACVVLGGQLYIVENEHSMLVLHLQIALVFLAGTDSPDDLCILYSNRAACYLKDGNSQDCIQDCTR